MRGLEYLDPTSMRSCWLGRLPIHHGSRKNFGTSYDADNRNQLLQLRRQPLIALASWEYHPMTGSRVSYHPDRRYNRENYKNWQIRNQRYDPSGMGLPFRGSLMIVSRYSDAKAMISESLSEISEEAMARAARSSTIAAWNC